MVKVKDILEKLSPEVKFGKKIMMYELGDVEFDTFEHKDYFVYEYTNSNNPNILLRIKDDFPFRLVLLEKRGSTTYGTTFNGFEKIRWKKEEGKRIEDLE